MESWCITIEGIYTPTLQRVKFSHFPALQCTEKSNFHWVVPCEVYCDRNSSGEYWRCWVGACPFHHYQGRRRECPIWCGRNADELKQHNAGGTSRSLTVHVLSLDHDRRQVRELAAIPNSAIAYALPGLINLKHTNSNAHCNPARGRVRYHGIRKWSLGEQKQEYCSST